MSKHPKSWYDKEFTRKTACEIHRRNFKATRARKFGSGNSNRPHIKHGGYALALRLDGKFHELTRFIAGEKSVQQHWRDINNGKFPAPCSNVGTAGPRP